MGTLTAIRSEPLYDEGAEQATLAAALRNEKALDRLVATLTPQDFYLRNHRGIFHAIAELTEAGTPVDPFILAAYLAGKAWFDQANGRDYLHTLAALPALASRADEYAQIVRDYARRREVAKVADDLAMGSLGPAEASERLREIAAESSRGAPFITALELSAETPAEQEPVWSGYLHRGTVGELSGRIKNGKTTFALALAQAVITGETFLEAETLRSPVLYLSEQNRPSFMAALERARLSGCPDLHLLFRHEYRAEWPMIAMGARRRALEVGAGLVIVDTLHEWASLGRDDENDAGAATAAMRPLHQIAVAGPAVLVLRHERKGGGEIGENARGSTAFGGSADVLLVLRRMNTAGHENRRELLAVSRFDSAPPKVVIELESSGYRLLGDGDELERQEARHKVLDLLPAREEEALSFDSILETCGEGVTRTTLHRALAQLLEEGAVRREKGAGHAGARSFGHWLPEAA